MMKPAKSEMWPLAMKKLEESISVLLCSSAAKLSASEYGSPMHQS